MSTKAQVKTQAKTQVGTAATRIHQHPVAEPEHEAERPDIAAQLEGAARLGHSLGAVGVDRSAPPIIQRQEIPEEEEEELQLKREPAAVQRQELPEEEEEELQMMPASAGEVALQRQELPEEEEELMMKRDDQRVGVEGGPVSAEVEAAIRRARGGGQPLDGSVQAQMSASLGHDFRGVRVHTDAEADVLNQQLQATAFTTGPDIFFKRGAYAPTSASGRALIAHELTHVVQQVQGRVRGGGRGTTVRPAGDAFEQEAEAQQRRLGTQEGLPLLPLQRAVARPDLASPADILALQRTVGNRAVQRLVAQRQGGERSKDMVEARKTLPNETTGTARYGMENANRSVIQRLTFETARNRVETAGAMMCQEYVAAIILQMNRRIKWKLDNDLRRARFLTQNDVQQILAAGTPITHRAFLTDIPRGAMIGIQYFGGTQGLASHVLISGGGWIAYDSHNTCAQQGEPPQGRRDLRTAICNGDGTLGGRWQVEQASWAHPNAVYQYIETHRIGGR